MNRADVEQQTAALAVVDVYKSFGPVPAVDGLSLTVAPGICMGLLGPNGAGKTTTMRMITGQALPDSGRIEVLGLPLPQQSKAARALMGVVPQQDNLDEELTAAENLRVFATLSRVPRARRAAAVAEALELAQLSDRADSRTATLSGGMRRRLLIARGLVHSPRLLLLDEPTVGLDPQVRSELWALIDNLRNSGVSILMSTHYIEEAERLADEVAVMHRGRLIAHGHPATLIATHAGAEALEYYGPPARLAEISEQAAAAGQPTRRTGPTVSVLRAETMPQDLMDQLGEAERRATTLEDVFVLLTGESIE